MTQEKKLSLKDEVLALAKEIRCKVELDTDTGVVSGDTTSVYNEHLPDGLTPSLVKSLSEYNTTYVAAGTYAVGEMAVEAFQKNSKIDRVVSELHLGYKDSFEVAFDRRTETKNNLQKDADGNPVTITKYGACKFSLNVNSANNVGQLKIARSLVSQMAAEALGKC